MKKYLLIISILLSANGCYYMDTASFETEIYSDYDPDVTITSNLNDLDSVRVVDSFYFDYQIVIDTGRLYYADLYLDDLLIYRSDTTHDDLWIFPYYLEVDGDYDLTMVAYYKSYTGSLADVLDSEPFNKDTTWVITVQRNIVE